MLIVTGLNSAETSDARKSPQLIRVVITGRLPLWHHCRRCSVTAFHYSSKLQTWLQTWLSTCVSVSKARRKHVESQLQTCLKPIVTTARRDWCSRFATRFSTKKVESVSKACRKPARTSRKPGCKPGRKPSLQPSLQLARWNAAYKYDTIILRRSYELTSSEVKSLILLC